MRHPLGVGLPVADRAMLVRRRLLDRLRCRWFAPVTVVSAPAGYGKTTLLAQAIAENDAAPLGIDCWLAWGRGLAGIRSFAEGLCQAVGARPVGLDRAGIEPVTEAVVEAMWRRSPQQVALVLDDVQEIAPRSDAAKLLESILAALPANGHVLLAGRSTPSVALARLELEGRVARLDQADLAFTEEEVAGFAALRGVPETRLAACGGWPALAELAASARAQLTGDYLSQEVLAPIDRTVRHSLALLAHLGPFDEQLAQAALDLDLDVTQLLAGLPLVTAVGPEMWTLHPLWQSLLADQATPAEIAASRRRAAGVLLERHDAGSAMPLLLQAEAWDEVGDAIVTALGAAHPPVPNEAPAEWYAALPPEVRTSPSGLLLGALGTAETDPAGAWERFTDCAAAFRAAGDAAGEVACLVQLARVAWWSEEPERLGSLVIRILELEAEGCEEAVALACIGRALLCDVQNDNARVLVELDAVPPGSLNEAWQGMVGWLRAVAYLQLGDAERSLQHAEHALDQRGDLHVPLAQGTKIQALWYQGRIAEAMALTPGVLQGLKDAGYRTHTALAAAQCSVASALQGDRGRAAELLALARLEAVAPDAPLVDTNVSIAAAVLALTDGDEATAAATLTACLDRHPLGAGLSAGAHLRNMALFYVLVPATRPRWEDAELGPAFLVARDLARMVSAVRELGQLPADAPPLPPTSSVGAHLGVRWTAELAVAAVADGREDGWRLLNETWPASRPRVMDIAANADDPLRKAAATVLARLPVAPAGRLELRILGPIELRRDGVLVEAPDWRRERVRLMLTYLALHPTVSRVRLADELWPDLDPDAQSRNLRVTMTYLLRVLEPERGSRDPSFFLRQHGGNVALYAGESLTVDVWEFDAACDRAAEADRAGSPAETLEHALRATEMWRGESTETAEPWALPLIERRRRRFAAVATRAGELLLARGDVHRAQALAERALDVDPWLEAGHRLVVAAHRANHDDLAARRALDRYKDAVHELGFSTGDATRMVERLLDSVPSQLSGLRM